MAPLRGPGSIVRVLRTGPWVLGKNRREAVFPKVDTPYGQALTGLRVQAPLGARVQMVQRVQRVEVGAF